MTPVGVAQYLSKVATRHNLHCIPLLTRHVITLNSLRCTAKVLASLESPESRKMTCCRGWTGFNNACVSSSYFDAVVGVCRFPSMHRWLPGGCISDSGCSVCRNDGLQAVPVAGGHTGWPPGARLCLCHQELGRAPDGSAQCWCLLDTMVDPGKACCILHTLQACSVT